MSDNEYEELISIDDLCSILCIGKNAAYNLLKTGQVKAFRIGRIWKIPKLSVQEYILTQSHITPNSTLPAQRMW